MTTVGTSNKDRVSNAIKTYELEVSKALAERLEAHIDPDDALECAQLFEVIRDYRDYLFNDEVEPARRFFVDNAAIVKGIRNRVVHSRGPGNISNEDCKAMLEQIAAALHWLGIEGAPEKVREYADMDEASPPVPERRNLRSLIPPRTDR